MGGPSIVYNKEMKLLILFILLFLVSCATKYIVPGNRFITPESQGGAFRGQVELQQTSGNQLAIDTSNNSIDDGVVYSDISRMGFLYSNSIFDPFDLYWTHIGSGNSMLGGKFQFIGGSRSSNSTGHKMSIAASIGGNEHESNDKKVEFELTGQEFLLLYGFRFSPNVLLYSSLSHAKYNFDAKIRSSSPSLNGARPNIDTKINSLSGGGELSYEAFFVKLEMTYQQLATTDTKDKSRFIFGYSLGMSW